MKFGSKLLLDALCGKSYICPCPLPLLHLAVINWGTQGSHQAVLREFHSFGPPSPPRLQSLSVQLRPSLPFIGSFLPLVSTSPVFCPLTLSPSISPHVLILHVHLWSSVSPQSRWVFSVSSDGRIVSAVFTQRPHVLLSHKITLGLLDYVLFGSTRAHIMIEFLDSFGWIWFMFFCCFFYEVLSYSVMPQLWYLIK